MIIIKEGNLTFQFPSDWHVCKYDSENHFYYNQVRRCEGAKAVDILAYSGNELFMIEAKDFRGDRIKNKDRILKGELVVEVTQKVRDTIAALYGAFRSCNEELQPFYSPFFADKPQPIKIVLLLEDDPIPEKAKHFKYRRSQLQKTINSHLKFLNVHCFVYNCSDLPKHFQWQVK